MKAKSIPVEQVPFSMAIENGGTHARVFSQTLAIGTVRLK